MPPFSPLSLASSQSRTFLAQLRNMSSLIREQAFVDGAWIGAASGKTFAVTNPMDGATVASVPDMDANDTNKAIDAAATVP